MKIGTVGTGFIVEWFITSVNRNEGATVLAVCSRQLETGKNLADRYQIEQVYTDYREMLGNEQIDTIYVASPNSLHYAYVKQALNAGKHVICEKPFTSTLQELEELIQLAKDKQLFLFEAIVTRYMPNYQIVKEMLPKLGKIHMVQCNFSQYSSRYDQFLAGKNPNVFNPDFSGGALMDLNIYNLHFTYGLFGKPKDALYFPNMAANGIDTSGVMVLQYDGFQAVCVGCKDSASDCMVQIQGEKGCLRVNGASSIVPEVVLHLRKEEAKSIGIKQIDPGLYYEVAQFVSMMESKDYERCYEELRQSYEVFEVLYHARKKAGIHFKSDTVSCM